MLAVVGFMSPADVEIFILTLRDVGLRFVEDGKCQDIAVVDQLCRAIGSPLRPTPSETHTHG